MPNIDHVILKFSYVMPSIISPVAGKDVQKVFVKPQHSLAASTSKYKNIDINYDISFL